jgi:ATP-dependent helicase/DNAse subunit B
MVISDSMALRLMQGIVEQLAAEEALEYVTPLAARRGFHALMLEIVLELKAAEIAPESYLAFWREQGQGKPREKGGNARLRDIGRIYAAWEARLAAEGWADRAATVHLALEVLRRRPEVVDALWSPIVFDGFDSFTQQQAEFIAAIGHARRTVEGADLVVTLTGDADERGPEPARRAHRRFHHTRLKLEALLQVQAQALMQSRPDETWQPELLHLQRTLFTPFGVAPPPLKRPTQPLGQPSQQQSGPAAVEMVEASSRALEAREALRRLKARMVVEEIPPEQCAVVARSIDLYRPHLLQAAAEFGIPLRFLNGLPLRENPAVAALLTLLRAVAPGAHGPALPRRAVVEIWRSPYFDLSAFGVQAGDADRIDSAARAGLVVAGAQQWLQALRMGVARAQRAQDEEAIDDGEEAAHTARADDAEAAARLLAAFEAFVARLTPPARAPIGQHAAWVDDLIGDEPHDAEHPDAARLLLEGEEMPKDGEASSLRIHHCAQVGAASATPTATAERDRAALHRLRLLVRDMVWAAERLEQGAADVAFGAFVQDLANAVEATSYHPPAGELGALIAAGMEQLRGLPLAVLAVLGMAEGELPQRMRDDPFLRDGDRAALRSKFPGLTLKLESAEYEFFHDTMTRPARALLLTRPRLAEDGAEWEPSPFWLEVSARLGAPPVEQLRLTSRPPLQRAASLSEVAAALGAEPASRVAGDLPAEVLRLLRQVAASAHVVALRARNNACDVNGDLRTLGDLTAEHFGPAYSWSPTALESYRACAFSFLAGRALGLEAPVEPEESFTVARRGSIFHKVLETLYRHVAAEEGDPADASVLLAALEEVAPAIFAAAPEREEFRAPQWWPALVDEMMATLRKAVVALAELGGRPLAFESAFGRDRPLILDAEGAHVRVGGYIDRIDLVGEEEDGTPALRIVDYKSGASGYERWGDLATGKKLQIALYAAAAEQALQMGRVVDGCYFFLNRGSAASWGLADYPGGSAQAIADAERFAVEAALGAREGRFAPEPPDDGCPNWCAAATFCAHYRPRATW